MEIHPGKIKTCLFSTRLQTYLKEIILEKCDTVYQTRINGKKQHEMTRTASASKDNDTRPLKAIVKFARQTPLYEQVNVTSQLNIIKNGNLCDTLHENAMSSLTKIDNAPTYIFRLDKHKRVLIQSGDCATCVSLYEHL